MSRPSHCPRCGGEFHCGVDDARPCACGARKLDAVLLATLRERFEGCLCTACLAELQPTRRAPAGDQSFL